MPKRRHYEKREGTKGNGIRVCKMAACSARSAPVSSVQVAQKISKQKGVLVSVWCFLQHLFRSRKFVSWISLTLAKIPPVVKKASWQDEFLEKLP